MSGVLIKWNVGYQTAIYQDYLGKVYFYNAWSNVFPIGWYQTFNLNNDNNLGLKQYEQICGSWVDDRPIYSQSFIFDIGTGTTPQSTLMQLDLSVDNIWIDNQNTFWINEYLQQFSNPYTEYDTNGLNLAFCFANNYQNLSAISYWKMTSSALRLFVTIRYTKSN